MFAICLESSHVKGMGHLFRMLNFSKFLKEKKQKYIFVVNNNENLKSILVSNSVSFQAVDFKDLKSNWEKLEGN